MIDQTEKSSSRKPRYPKHLERLLGNRNLRRGTVDPQEKSYGRFSPRHKTLLKYQLKYSRAVQDGLHLKERLR